jgi:hypothetical protein
LSIWLLLEVVVVARATLVAVAQVDYWLDLLECLLGHQFL